LCQRFFLLLSTSYETPKKFLPHCGAKRAGRARSWCLRGGTFARMIDKRMFDDLNERIGEALRASPAADIEKNLRAVLKSWFDRLDLVSREDFDIQRKLLERAQARLTGLEARLAELEAKAGEKPAA
jgi:BMFP domain-containing protein YqiC